MLPPGSTIGIVGAGQLGRMSAIAAARLGYLVHIFAPEPGPANQVAAKSTFADYDDLAALRRFADEVDVITFEFENIPSASLALLESQKTTHPSAAVLNISQDRILEKQFLNDAGIPTAPWSPIHNEAALADQNLPVVLKTTRLGYDGKGQATIRAPAELGPAYGRLAPRPLILESLIDFACEISVIVARNETGIVTYDPVENRHKNHILDLTLAPARLPAELLAQATAIARRAAEQINLTGLLCVEMFVTADGALLANEIAPRPHNSGHWTLDACYCSQFEMHIRAIAGLPLPPATRHSDAVMKNLIGAHDIAKWPAILGTPGLLPHHYGKPEARPGRKLGHYTRLFPKGALPGEFGIEDAITLGETPSAQQ